MVENENKEQKGLKPVSDSLKKESIEKPKVKSGKGSGKGGKREGAGRPKGSMNEETKELLASKREYRRRIAKNASRLLNSQLKLAEGVSYLFRIDKDKDGKKQKPVLVTDQGEIMDYLDGQFEGEDDTYYYITTDKPDNRAIDSMLDRAFGKPDASLDVTSDGKEIKAVTIFKFDESKRKTERSSDNAEQPEDGTAVPNRASGNE